MSGQPFQYRPGAPGFNTFPADRTIGSPQQLAQFTAATATGYSPRAQSQIRPATYPSGSTTTDASQQVKPSKPMSEFAASFYAAGENAAQATTTQQSKPPSLHLQPPPAQTVDATFKGFKFVTLDGFQIETREVYDEISGTYQWEMCESQVDRCITYVREQCADRRVFLVASGSLGRQAVPEIDKLPQVYAIYIYCADVKANREWADKHPKVRVVCNNDDQDLLPQFAVDVAQANLEWGEALLKQNKRDLAIKKFEKALTNLTKHAKNPDPAMVAKVKSKIEECK
jgi:hypothetical protein